MELRPGVITVFTPLAEGIRDTVDSDNSNLQVYPRVIEGKIIEKTIQREMKIASSQQRFELERVRVTGSRLY